jgi:hypothetical protein
VREGKKFQKPKKKNWLGKREKIKFQKKKNQGSGEEKNWEGGGEKIKLQKKS